MKILNLISKWLNIGDIKPTSNKSRKFGSADRYYSVRCFKSGKECWLLMTPHEFLELEKRAKENKEDLV